MTLTFKTLDTLIDGNALTLIVAIDGGAAGSIVGTICVIHEGKEQGEITRLFVKADRRMQTLGKLLMVQAETTAKESGCESTNLKVKAANRGVCEFYRKCGYFVAHEWDDGDLIMAKRL